MYDNGNIFMGGFIIGMAMMLTILFFAEPEWIQPARKAKAQCEENIPRKEVCVAVFLPRSKD